MSVTMQRGKKRGLPGGCRELWVAGGFPSPGHRQRQGREEKGLDLSAGKPGRRLSGKESGGLPPRRSLGRRASPGRIDSSPFTLRLTEQGQVRAPPSSPPPRNVVGGPTLRG